MFTHIQPQRFHGRTAVSVSAQCETEAADAGRVKQASTSPNYETLRNLFFKQCVSGSFIIFEQQANVQHVSLLKWQQSL